MTTTAYQRQLDQWALEHDCPTCGAPARHRCRDVIHRPPIGPGYPKNNPPLVVFHRPCPERVHLAWTTKEGTP